MSKLALTFLCIFSGQSVRASDHADPIDPLNRLRQEGAITDLFAFPITSDGLPAYPFSRSAKLPLHDTLADVVRTPLTMAERKNITAIVFIICVRRQLTDRSTLRLEPFTYKLHIDYNSEVELPMPDDSGTAMPQMAAPDSSGYGTDHEHKPDSLSVVEAFARYGGKIPHPEEILEDLTIEFRLNNQGGFQEGYPRASRKGLPMESYSGIHDDPFIFPAFFGTNTVAMAVQIPIEAFPADRTDFLIWTTSHQGSKQIDHVGRSLRTQNPRFELLNKLHPSKHVAAIVDEHTNPSLMRDVFLRLNFAQTFAYRKWDFAPDVMCLSTRVGVGFPNGRLLTDDVAAILAQHGDTLLYELAFQHNNYRWPRQKVNDLPKDGSGQFNAEFPYLLPPHAERSQPPPPRLSMASIIKLLLIGLLIISLLVLSHWLFARFYHRRQLRVRYL
jgi:hypothetical protein